MTHQNRKQTVPVRYSFPAVFLYLEMIPLCIFLYRGNEERSVSIMDFVRDDIRSIFRKYAFASIGSALAMSIYSMVDTIAVGHSTGAVGTAAMAVITPVYGTQAFLSSLCGVGGTVLMTKEKAMQNIKKGNSYFTVSLLMLSVLTAITWVLFGFFHNPLFRFFGATDEVLVYVNQYADLVIAFWPIFLFMIYLSLFLRSDGKPKLAFLSVLIGGGTNIFGDWFFCFPLKMGMRGAALATVIGSAIQVMIPILYLFSGKSSIRIEKPENLLQVVHDIAVIGFGSGIIELATVILAILLNNQITKYGGVAALSVYGIIATSNSLIQSMFSGLGQSVQPAVSANYSAKQYERIRELLKMAAITCVIMEILFVLLGELFPDSARKALYETRQRCTRARAGHDPHLFPDVSVHGNQHPLHLYSSGNPEGRKCDSALSDARVYRQRSFNRSSSINLGIKWRYGGNCNFGMHYIRHRSPDDPIGRKSIRTFLSQT
jgi:Na+-driven multidrug efflux pump